MSEKASAGGAKKGGKNMIVVIVLVIGLAGGVFAGKTFFGGKEKTPEKPKVGHSLSLGEFVVNLNDSHFLKTEIALGMKEGIQAEKLKEETAPLRDIVIMTLSGKERNELNSIEGKEGAKEKIKSQVNKILKEKTKEEESVLEVYFTSFATQ